MEMQVCVYHLTDSLTVVGIASNPELSISNSFFFRPIRSSVSHLLVLFI